MVVKQKFKLENDFGIWWDLPKYKNLDIEAKRYANNYITKVMVGNKDWPGPEKDVKYWVILDNGKAVGFRHGMSDGGKRRAKYADFPVYDFTG